MPRRRRAETREILPDPVYNSTLAEKFVNSMMWDGKKATSQRIFYGAMDRIRERTGEGRTRAMANGVKFGRKRKLSDYQRAEAIKRRDAGETLAAIAKSYGVAISMISRL